MFKQYPYRPLATKSTVRLIKLEKLKVEYRIACKILHAEQFTAEYDALSYVWGDDTPRRDILIYNDDDLEWTSFRVHENLWQFLDNAWQRKMFDRWLWTDRICLNQNDDEEKREQIPRMADLYYNATRVIAWLGLSVTHGEHLLPVCGMLRMNEKWWEHENWWEMEGKEYWEESAPAVKAVLEAEYWERVWIVQEFVSSKELVFFIGNVDLTFHEVSDLTLLHDSKSRCGFHKDVKNSAYISTGGHSPKLDLGELLRLVTANHFKCQQPHDLVYGIFGLVANQSDGTSPLEHIEIDYDKPPADVFLDAILESLESYIWYSEYIVAINLLLDRPDNAKIWEPIFTFFTRYTESDLTSQRHRNLARLILSVSDALYIIPSASGSPPENWYTYAACYRLVHEIRIAFHDKGVKPTVEFSSVIFGLGLALAIHDEGRSGMLGDRKACRLSIVEASSPWRCAAHQLSVRSWSPSQHVARPMPGGKRVITSADVIYRVGSGQESQTRRSARARSLLQREITVDPGIRVTI